MDVEAIQFTGGRKSADEVAEFAGTKFIVWWFNHDRIGIGDREDSMIQADPDDWIIREAGEYRICKPDVFAATYYNE